MPKYDSGTMQRRNQRDVTIHPIWRGVGFIFMILIPILSYFTAMSLIAENTTKHWLPVPFDLMAKPGNFLYTGDPYLYIKVIVTLVIIAVLFTLFSLATFFVYSLSGGSRLGPYDLPPINKPRGTRFRKR